MQGRGSKSAAVSTIGLKYGAGVSTSKLQLLEVDEAFLDEIFSNETNGPVAQIKMA